MLLGVGEYLRTQWQKREEKRYYKKKKEGRRRKKENGRRKKKKKKKRKKRRRRKNKRRRRKAKKKKSKEEKKRHHNQRIVEIKHSSFTPLVFSAYGGETQHFFSTLANKIATKKALGALHRHNLAAGNDRAFPCSSILYARQSVVVQTFGTSRRNILAWVLLMSN